MQRGLAALYLIAFLVVLQQFKPLLGERGLLPVPAFVKRLHFWEAPSIFLWRYSDRMLDAVAWVGILLSAVALSGLSEVGPIWISIGIWLLLWVLYLSIYGINRSGSDRDACCAVRAGRRDGAAQHPAGAEPDFQKPAHELQL